MDSTADRDASRVGNSSGNLSGLTRTFQGSPGLQAFSLWIAVFDPKPGKFDRVRRANGELRKTHHEAAQLQEFLLKCARKIPKICE